MKHQWFAAIALITACGGGAKPAAAPVAPDSVLEISDLTFSEAGKPGMWLHADGRLEVMGHHVDDKGVSTDQVEAVGTLAADGTVTSKNQQVARFHADGTVEGRDGKIAPFRIEGDALVMDGKHVTITDRGALVVDGTETPMHVEGFHDAKAKRTALLLVAFMMGGHGEPHSEVGPADASPSTP